MEILITFFHIAASKFFNAVNVFAAAFVEASHVISCPLTFAPTLAVKCNAHIFVVTAVITIWLTLWTATSSFFNVIQITSICSIEAVQEITVGTYSPDMFPGKKKNNRQRTT